MSYDPKKGYSGSNPIAAGTHLAYCTQCKFDVSNGVKTKGAEVWIMRWQILAGADKGRVLMFQRITLVDESWGYGVVNQFYDAARLERHSPHDREWVQEKVVGAVCRIKVKHEIYNDEKRAKISSWAALDDKDTARLQELYGDGQGYTAPDLPEDAFEPPAATFSDDEPEPEPIDDIF